MADHSDKNLNEALLQEGSQFNVTSETLNDLFHPDNIKNFAQGGEKISESNYNLWNNLGGPQGLLAALKTHAKTGIEGSKDDISSRVNKFGSNKKRIPKIRTLWELVCENFEDTILQILLLAALVALVIGVVQHGLPGAIEGGSIFFAVAIIVAVTSGQNYMKEKQFQKLVTEANKDTVAVYRGHDGSTHTINSEELVVGDIIKLETGMKIPADCLFLEGFDVSTDEAAMTGESDNMDKTPLNEKTLNENPDCYLLAKTLLIQGQGTALVLAVGSNSRSGQAEEKLNIEEEATPLQLKLETIANEIGKLGVYVSILTFTAMTINLVIKRTLMTEEDGGLIHVKTLESLVDFIIIAITVIVVAVPEGLPLAVTISLAFSVMQMKKDNNLVRKLQSSETMGGANEICTDKTGTLTLNKMTVRKVWHNDTVVTDSFPETSHKTLVSHSVLFNCSARIEQEGSEYIVRGNCTEVGIINYLLQHGVQGYQILQQKEDKILQTIPFNSSRKRASNALVDPNDSDRVLVFSKGAPEIVINHCSKYLNAGGEETDLDEEKKSSIVDDVVVNQFAKNALRTILVAYKSMSVSEYETLKSENNDFKSESDREVLEQDLTIIAIFALQDPLRPEIIEASVKCKKAGIKIRMVTGDNINTAKAIALEAGIITEEEMDQEYVCMEGKQFREICGGLKKLEDPSDRNLLKEEIGNKAVFRQVEKKLRVLARSTPEDKYMLVTGLKELNSVVAVTGDGTNDAPALKKADVGFAMGIAGTEVAKEASDIILLDDNFNSIVTAVKWGRNIYTNVRKFLQFQLTVNVVAMFIVFSGGVILGEAPLTSVQMLWVNLIMDTFAALALATEPPAANLLEQQPYSRTEQIVTPTMWRNILGQSVYQIAVLLVMVFFGKKLIGFTYPDNTEFLKSLVPPVKSSYQDSNLYNEDVIKFSFGIEKLEHFTMIFNAFVFMQVFNEINSRKLGAREFNVFESFFNNSLFIIIILLTIVVQITLVEYAGLPLRCVPLNWNEHIICLIIGMFSLCWGVVIKFVPPHWFDRLHMKEDTLTEEEEKQAFTTQFRKSFRASHRASSELRTAK